MAFLSRFNIWIGLRDLKNCEEYMSSDTKMNDTSDTKIKNGTNYKQKLDDEWKPAVIREWKVIEEKQEQIDNDDDDDLTQDQKVGVTVSSLWSLGVIPFSQEKERNL